MFIQILISLFFGILLGCVTGLIPGIHINLISVLIISVSNLLLKFVDTITVVIVITAMAVTHTFLDTIPSTYLGAPEPNQILSVLPAHRLLHQGKGKEAVMLTVLGSLGALIISILMVPLLIKIVIVIYPFISKIIAYILILIILFLISREKQKLFALSLFLIAGLLGWTVLNMKFVKNPLFPLLSGLFGISTLFLSFKNSSFLPEQVSCKKLDIDKKTSLKAIICAFFTGWLCSFMPGLGPSQAAIIGSSFVRKLNENGFLILVGGLSTVNMVLSFVTLYSLEKARNGAVIAISNILAINGKDLFVIVSVILIVGGAATFLASFFSKGFSKLITKVDYKKLCTTIIVFIFILVLALSGIWGSIILIISTLTGILPSLKGIGKNHLMGCLLLPVTLFFLGF